MEPLRAEDPRQVGRYRLEARLGSGGMGQVFLGFSPAGRPMAVKVVHRELARDRAFLSRFRQEVAAARKVSGAYTAAVVDAGDGDLPWLATTLVVGPSLADAVEQLGPLPEVSVWRLAAGLAEALAEVHSCGLIHRDLKPSNVLLAADGHRDARGHSLVHVARAGERDTGRPGQRRVLVRRGAGLRRDRTRAVRRRQRGRPDLPGGARGAGAGRPARRAGRPAPAVSGQAHRGQAHGGRADGRHHRLCGTGALRDVVLAGRAGRVHRLLPDPYHRGPRRPAARAWARAAALAFAAALA